jgi:hypothetical protein
MVGAARRAALVIDRLARSRSAFVGRDRELAMLGGIHASVRERMDRLDELIA